MATVLLQFGVILIVVLMGFAASFFALFRGVDSFEDTLLHLFKAILGDVALFDELEYSSRERYAVAGYLLLVIFVIVMTIMLLNLLIAILSTKHADIHSNADREFKVSTAQTVAYYRLAVELDILPAPFNLLQALVSLTYFATGRQQSGSCRQLKRAVGQVIFWFTLGPIAIVAGTLLWIVSIPHAIPLLRNNRVKLSIRYWLGSVCFYLMFVIGVPIFIVGMWLKEPFMWVLRVYEFLSKGSSSVMVEHVVDDLDVQTMLIEIGLSANELRMHLENPMIDLKVQPDEAERSATVEHVKLLRDYLKERSEMSELRVSEKMAASELKLSQLGNGLNEQFASSERRISELRDEMQEKFLSTERKVSELRVEINDKLAKILEVLEMKHNSDSREGGRT